MTKPNELTKHSESLLTELDLKLVNSQDNGMHKSFEWKNGIMKFYLSYDRGYYDCYLIPNEKPINSLSIIHILRFVKNDFNYYEEELNRANLWNTLDVNEYVELMYSQYGLIKDFFSNYDNDKYETFRKFLEKKTPYNMGFAKMAGDVVLENFLHLTKLCSR